MIASQVRSVRCIVLDSARPGEAAPYGGMVAGQSSARSLLASHQASPIISRQGKAHYA
jgi:hypothetical protein